MQCNGFEKRDSLLKNIFVFQLGTAIKGKNQGANYSSLPFKKNVGVDVQVQSQKKGN